MPLSSPSLIALALLALLNSTGLAATPKAKYGPMATRLATSNEYIRKNAAPDYWAISPYYVGQENEWSCSVASITMIVNAARADQELTADDELANETSVVKRSGSKTLKSTASRLGPRITLDTMGPAYQAALRTHGFEKAAVETFHVNDTSAETKAKVHRALSENEKSAKDFIVTNFIQGVYTGDADVGHVAPVGAYDTEKKQALIFDPDRKWYEPYWVSLDTLVTGMATLDKDAGKNRGFVWVKLNQ